MFPLRDSIPSSRVPLVNLTLIVACVAVFLFTMTELPAPVFLVLWFVMQFFSGTLSLATAGAASGGVAWFAHIGGFAAGAVLAIWLRRSGRVRPAPRHNVERYNVSLE